VLPTMGLVSVQAARTVSAAAAHQTKDRLNNVTSRTAFPRGCLDEEVPCVADVLNVSTVGSSVARAGAEGFPGWRP
jgi:hypothetical protein